jgi:hypothetical protein
MIVKMPSTCVRAENSETRRDEPRAWRYQDNQSSGDSWKPLEWPTDWLRGRTGAHCVDGAGNSSVEFMLLSRMQFEHLDDHQPFSIWNCQ